MAPMKKLSWAKTEKCSQIQIVTIGTIDQPFMLNLSLTVFQIYYFLLLLAFDIQRIEFIELTALQLHFPTESATLLMWTLCPVLSLTSRHSPIAFSSFLATADSRCPCFFAHKYSRAGSRHKRFHDSYAQRVCLGGRGRWGTSPCSKGRPTV